jgi:hypothetical protein
MEVYIKSSKHTDLMLLGETKRKNLKNLLEEGYAEIQRIVTKEPTWS